MSLPKGREAPPPVYVRRFGRGTRLLHWVHAIPFFFLLFSGLSLLVPELKGLNLFGNRIVPTLHIVAGGVFILGPVAVYLSLGDRELVHRDVRRLVSVSRDDLRWLKYAVLFVLGSGAREPPARKFNMGQKLNTLYTVVVGGGLIVTGVILTINVYRKGVFSLEFVETMFPLHDLFMVAAIPAVAGHVYLATINPSTREALRGITRGVVRREWARRHHPRWLQDEDGRGLP